MNVIDGGDFGSGFASGAVSSLISSGVQGLHIKGKDFKNVLTIASGGLSGGISSSIAGGNFWAGVRQGLITSGLNHVAHGFKSKINGGNDKSLSDYENEINTLIDERIKGLDLDISKEKSIINNSDSTKGEIRRATRRGIDYNRQRSALIGAKSQIQKLIHESHGYTITTSTNGIPSGTNGTLKWGNNDKSLVLVFNGNIRTLIHEAIHAYDVAIRGYKPANNFTIGGRIHLPIQTEINAWRVTFSLRNNDTTASSFNDIDLNFIKELGY